MCMQHACYMHVLYQIFPVTTFFALDFSVTHTNTHTALRVEDVDVTSLLSDGSTRQEAIRESKGAVSLPNELFMVLGQNYQQS